MHVVKGGTSDWPDAAFPGIRINPQSLMPQIVNDEALPRRWRPRPTPGT